MNFIIDFKYIDISKRKFNVDIWKQDKKQQWTQAAQRQVKDIKVERVVKETGFEWNENEFVI